ncbi:MAG: hypothetical protein SXG53_19785, partial [Pseudomonadota bacterium]|nr:hypothetical protein [Pseudomonadota bacterium]
MLPRPCSALVQFRFGIRPQVKLSYAVAVGKAWLTARIAFSRLSIQRLVERVQDRKARAGRGAWDVQQARDLVTAFLWLRPLYYTARDACLFDSLVLLEMLAQYLNFKVKCKHHLARLTQAASGLKRPPAMPTLFITASYGS